jgi:hypothetical protein
VILLAIGITAAWGMHKAVLHLPGEGPGWLVLLFASLATAISCIAGGTNGIGLGTEVRHLSWLVRYPIPPKQLLAAVAGVPAAIGTVMLLVLMGPSLFTAGDHRGTLAVAFAAGVAITAGVRMLRVVVWLRFPPPPTGASTLTELLHGAAFAFPMGLATIIGGVIIAAQWLPIAAATALAGAPSIVIVGLGWPAAVRSLRRLEMR